MGGNVLMYQWLCHENHQLLASFMQVISQTERNLQLILEESQQLYRAHIFNATGKDWRLDFLYCTRIVESSKIELQKCKRSIINLLEAMKQVNSNNYQKEVQEKIANFKEIESTVSTRSLPSIYSEPHYQPALVSPLSATLKTIVIETIDLTRQEAKQLSNFTAVPQESTCQPGFFRQKPISNQKINTLLNEVDEVDEVMSNMNTKTPVKK